jgi:ParB-like chromosome segregation protein Spo0J
MPERIKFQKGQAELERKAQALGELRIEYVPPDTIRPNEYNPNRQSDFEFELLRRSIRSDGFTQPVLITEDRVIVDGEHRWRAAQAEGYDVIPIVVVPFGDAQARISTLRHNRARGTEDAQLSAQVLRDLVSLGALEELGTELMLTPVELERLSTITPPEELEELRVISPDVEPGRRASRSMTPGQVEQARQAEQASREDTRERELEVSRRESNTFRLSLTYTQEEATVVRRVLGKAPAQVVVRLCREALAAR